MDLEAGSYSSQGSFTVPRKPLPPATARYASTNRADGEAKPAATALQTNAQKSPILQTPFAFLIAALTVAAYGLTVAYALNSTGIFHVSWGILSPSRTITVLRALSEVTGLLLVSLIHNALERLQWLLGAREGGVSFPGFLALGASISKFGAMKLFYRQARGARLWSLSSLAALLTVPVMSVVLLSQVDVGLFFKDLSPYPVSAGIGKFNASYATLYHEITPIYVTTDFSSLLQNNKWAYETAPVDQNACSQTDPSTGQSICGPSYFLHGGIELVTPWPTANTSEPGASAYTLKSVTGLHIDFRTLDDNAYFNGPEDCIVAGEEDGALQICISTSADNSINAKFVQCPLEFSMNDSCLTNTTWQSSTGWTMTMAVYNRVGTVHLSRSNLSTLAVTELSAPISVAIAAGDLLSVYDATLAHHNGSFCSTNTAGQLLSFLSVYLTLAESSTTSYSEAGSYLRNLLAIPLLYFQPTYFSPITLATPVDPTALFQGLPENLYTEGAFSNPSYRLVVAPWTVWLYVGGLGAVIVVCLFILFLGSLRVYAHGVPDTTAWPLVDFSANCVVEDGSGSGTSKVLTKLKALEGKKRIDYMQDLRLHARL